MLIINLSLWKIILILKNTSRFKIFHIAPNNGAFAYLKINKSQKPLPNFCTSLYPALGIMWLLFDDLENNK